MPNSTDPFLAELEHRGVSRRGFLTFCGAMATAMAMPKTVGAQIAEAIRTKQKPTLVWLEFQDCAGNTEAFLRAGRPTAADVILDTLSVDYHETIMAAAGHRAEENLHQVVAEKPGEYIAIVEGSIPTGAGGAYCTIGGRSALDIAREVCGGAAATIAIGTCAAFGGLPAAAPNPTGALSVADAVPGIKNLINLPACPANAENLAGGDRLLHHLQPPATALDRYGRPLFAYGKSIHDNCERRAHYDAGQYVEEWGDDGPPHSATASTRWDARDRSPTRTAPTFGWNEGTNWPIGCGHPCIGCAEPDFWDQMTPFLPVTSSGFPGFGMHSNIDRIGLTGARSAWAPRSRLTGW